MANPPSLSNQDQFYQANGGGVGKSIQDLMLTKVSAGLTTVAATLRRSSADGQMNLYGKVKFFQ